MITFDDSLDEADFKWSIETSPRRTFDERFEELMKFKDEFGHCNVPQTKSCVYYALGQWCSNLRKSYKQIQRRETPRYTLAHEGIRRLEEADFKWSIEISPRRTFDERF